MKRLVAKAAAIVLLAVIVLLIKVNWLTHCCKDGDIADVLIYQFADFCLMLFFGVELILIVFSKK